MHKAHIKCGGGGGGGGEKVNNAATTPAPILPLSLFQRISLKGSTY